MKRCKNVTVSPMNITEVRKRAERLLQEINDIQFVMTPEEQEGLYSLIRNLEWEAWDREMVADAAADAKARTNQNNKLKELLAMIKESPNEPIQ